MSQFQPTWEQYAEYLANLKEGDTVKLGGFKGGRGGSNYCGKKKVFGRVVNEKKVELIVLGDESCGKQYFNAKTGQEAKPGAARQNIEYYGPEVIEEEKLEKEIREFEIEIQNIYNDILNLINKREVYRMIGGYYGGLRKGSENKINRLKYILKLLKYDERLSTSDFELTELEQKAVEMALEKD